MPESEPFDPKTKDDFGRSDFTVIEPVTCLACGCLCDDIAIVSKDDRLVEARNACDRGREWFLRDRSHNSTALPARINGNPSSAVEGVEHAARLLAAARAPVFLGLAHSTNETVAAALELADRIGAAVDPGDGRTSMAGILAFQRSGRVSATLGEVKARADVVVFWRADPVVTHPRHWERYSVWPRGRFIPEGRTGRTVIVADRQRTATAEQADLFVKIDEAQEFETLWALRALVRGVSMNAGQTFAKGTDPDLEELCRLASRLQAARYGAFFHGPVHSLGRSTEAAAIREAMYGLVRDLNQQTRFVVLGMGEPGNIAGAEAVLSWQTGFPTSLDLSPGHPRSLPGVTSVGKRLSRREADLALIVGSLDLDSLEPSALEHLGRIPRIRIAPADEVESGPLAAEVALCAAVPGLEDKGSVMRIDGVSLPLKPIRSARFFTERQWVEAISELIRSHATT